MGSHRQKMTFIYDTGSSWLWFPTEDCVDCDGDIENEVYHNSKSSTYEKASNYHQSVRYTKGNIEGYEIFDRVCLDDTTQGLQEKNCLPRFTMLGIYLSHELDDLKADGILGLAPSNQGSRSKLFVEELYNAGIIG